MTIVQRISYAKTKSYATSRREDPEFVPPTSVHARPDVARIGKFTVSSLDKRQRTEDSADGQPQAKRDKSQDDSDDGEEMEIDEDEEKEQHRGSGMSTSSIYQWENSFTTCPRSRHPHRNTAPSCIPIMYESTTRSDRRRPFGSVPAVRNVQCT